jgi:selenoprotein W-related protein
MFKTLGFVPSPPVELVRATRHWACPHRPSLARRSWSPPLPATVRFLVPSLSQSGGGGVEGNRVCIEYCTGCRWGLRASWMASELLVTFNDRSIGEVAIRPSNEPGTFDVWVVRNADGLERRVWCRKEEGGFPELKELKQRIRDIVAPQQDLGHSDCRSEEPSAS